VLLEQRHGIVVDPICGSSPYAQAAVKPCDAAKDRDAGIAASHHAYDEEPSEHPRPSVGHLAERTM
jgi:hypothetical protein